MNGPVVLWVPEVIPSHNGVAGAIVAAADANEAAVVVVGARGRSALRHRLLGGVSHAVVQRSRRPVLVVPPEAETDVAGTDRVER